MNGLIYLFIITTKHTHTQNNKSKGQIYSNYHVTFFTINGIIYFKKEYKEEKNNTENFSNNNTKTIKQKLRQQEENNNTRRKRILKEMLKGVS